MTALFIALGVVVVVLLAALLLVARSRRASGSSSVGPGRSAAALDEPPPEQLTEQLTEQLPELVPEPEPQPPSYRSRLGTVRGIFSGAVSSLRSGKIDAATVESLEEALIRADVGVQTTMALLKDLRSRVDAKEIAGGTDLLSALGDAIRALLDVPESRQLRFDGTAAHWRRLRRGQRREDDNDRELPASSRRPLAGHSILSPPGEHLPGRAADQLGMRIRGGHRGQGTQCHRLRCASDASPRNSLCWPTRPWPIAHQAQPGGGAQEDPPHRRS